MNNNHLDEKEHEIPLTEDLMREHGILNRVLLVYEEIIRRIDNNINYPIDALKHGIVIIKKFIEEYHEELEETYVFPLFKKNNIEVKLVETLTKQHNQGRKVTSKIKDIIDSKAKLNQKENIEIKKLMQKFIDMYRPHEAREDTVLFPQVRDLINEKEFKELSEKFEKIEHEKFGEHGFNDMVQKITAIEKELGIYKLEQFTPYLNNNSNNK